MLSEVLKTYTKFSAMILYGLDKGIFNGTKVFGNEKTSKTDDQVGDEEAVLLSEILQEHTTLCVLNLCCEPERKKKGI